MGFKASVKQCCLCSTLFGEGKTGHARIGSSIRKGEGHVMLNPVGIASQVPRVL